MVVTDPTPELTPELVRRASAHLDPSAVVVVCTVVGGVLHARDAWARAGTRCEVAVEALMGGCDASIRQVGLDQLAEVCERCRGLLRTPGSWAGAPQIALLVSTLLDAHDALAREDGILTTRIMHQLAGALADKAIAHGTPPALQAWRRRVRALLRERARALRGVDAGTVEAWADDAAGRGEEGGVVDAVRGGWALGALSATTRTEPGDAQLAQLALRLFRVHGEVVHAPRALLDHAADVVRDEVELARHERATAETAAVLWAPGAGGEGDLGTLERAVVVARTLL